MKFFIILFLSIYSMIANSKTLVEQHGHLKVKNTHLVNEAGEIVQLKGVATHGLQWFGDFYNNGNAIKSAIQDWNVQIIRLTVYLYEDGYLDNENLTQEDFDKMIFSIADSCIENGIYCIIDWHIHHPGFPSFYLQDAKKFFEKIAKKYADIPNILYEIANEPNNTGYKNIKGHEVSWQEIKEYSEAIIPIIRKHAPRSIVLVGTPSWSSLGQSTGRKWQEVTDSPLNFKNILYVLHFYAGGHSFYEAVNEAAKKIPLFVTEWASASWSIDSENDLEKTALWLKILDEHQIGWTYWNFAPGNSIYSPFEPGVKPNLKDLHPKGDNISETGKLLFELLNK